MNIRYILLYKYALINFKAEKLRSHVADVIGKTMVSSTVCTLNFNEEQVYMVRTGSKKQVGSNIVAILAVQPVLEPERCDKCPTWEISWLRSSTLLLYKSTKDLMLSKFQKVLCLGVSACIPIITVSDCSENRLSSSEMMQSITG